MIYNINLASPNLLKVQLEHNLKMKDLPWSPLPVPLACQGMLAKTPKSVRFLVLAWHRYGHWSPILDGQYELLKRNVIK